MLKVIVPVLVGVTSVIVIFSTILCCLRSRKKPVFSSPSRDQVSGLSYVQLFKAPEGFSPNNLIGQRLWFCVQGNF